MWVFLAILSAIGLGGYDICKKRALSSLRVFPVLFWSIACSSILLTIPYLLSRLMPEWFSTTLFYIPYISYATHARIFMKSVLVLSSWVCAYYAMRRLPITVVTPLNATRPMWTLLGAVFIFGEVLNGWQWGGVVLALISFTAFTFVSMHGGDSHSSDAATTTSIHHAYVAMFAAVLLGAASGLYDKHLMRSIDHNAVLVFYTWYQLAIMLTYALIRYVLGRLMSSSASSESLAPLEERVPEGRERGLILGISVFLLAADFVYLRALRDPDSLIAVVSLIRRGSVLITFTYGAIFLHERNIRQKAICLVGILMAMILLLLGSI